MVENRISRRKLLLRTGPNLIVGGTALVLGIKDRSSINEITPPIKPDLYDRSPESVFQGLNTEAVRAYGINSIQVQQGSNVRENIPLPRDLLGQEELHESHIQVNQTADTTLILRRGIFDHDLFRDARNGHVNKVVITLVDEPTIFLEGAPIDKLSDEAKSALSIFRSITMTRNERLMFLNPLIAQWESHVALLEKAYSPIELASARKTLEKLRLERFNVPSENTASTGYFMSTNRVFLESVIQVHKSVNPENPIIQRLKDFISKNPELLDRVYFFVASSEHFRGAKPSQSIPDPSILVEIEGANQESESYRYKSVGYPGIVLLHEVCHYSPQGGPLNEYKADTKVNEFITRAWQKFNETGDTTGYPFVFLNNHGMTITKNLSEDFVGTI